MRPISLYSIVATLALLVATHISYAHDDVVIIMEANTFSTTTVTIHTGDTVIFKNEGTGEHWPASNIHPTHKVYPNSGIEKCGGGEEKNIFDSCRGIKPGESYSFTFLYPGSWRFHDHIHANITGTIVVVGEGPAVSRGENISFMQRVISWAKGLYTKTYYGIFQKKRDAALESLDIFSIADTDEELREWLTVFGPKALMAKLLRDAENDGNVRDCHQQAHQIGRVAFKVEGASVFKEGNTECNSGFYHGAMEEFLIEEGTDNIAANIEGLCSKFSTGFTTFECLHGSGHGIMAYEDYNMTNALAECDHFSNDFGKRSCYGGVFMENIIAAQGLGAVKAHETSWVSATDMHFPCNAIGEDFGKRYECYQMQTAWMLTLTHNNFPTVVESCLKASSDMIPVCFKSLGRDIAGYTLRQGPNILSFCNLVPRTKDYYSQCIIGAVNVIVDYWGPQLASQGSDFCALITDTKGKEACKNTLDWRVKDLFDKK